MSAGDTETQLKVCVSEAVLKDDKLAKMDAQLHKVHVVSCASTFYTI